MPTRVTFHVTSAKAGDCQGNKFDEHLSPLAGLGQKAVDDPGGPSDGANVELTWKGAKREGIPQAQAPPIPHGRHRKYSP
jgi:hypothetical protein